MVYGMLAGNKLHLSETARSLKKNITLKKTIDRLSGNSTYSPPHILSLRFRVLVTQ